MRRPVSSRNVERFPTLHVGDRIRVINSKIPFLNGEKGRVVGLSDKTRSPHKKLVKIDVEGEQSAGNPWYVFRSEVELVANGVENGNHAGN